MNRRLLANSCRALRQPFPGLMKEAEESFTEDGSSTLNLLTEAEVLCEDLRSILQLMKEKCRRSIQHTTSYDRRATNSGSRLKINDAIKPKIVSRYRGNSQAHSKQRSAGQTTFNDRSKPTRCKEGIIMTIGDFPTSVTREQKYEFGKMMGLKVLATTTDKLVVSIIGNKIQGIRRRLWDHPIEGRILRIRRKGKIPEDVVREQIFSPTKNIDVSIEEEINLLNLEDEVSMTEEDVSQKSDLHITSQLQACDWSSVLDPNCK
jgi:hypothetical protein